jgi:transcriptional regulator with XRE-family HTH domain
MPQCDVASSSENSTNQDPSASFGQLLRKHRLRLKMSQEALAAKSGYERAFISLIELGKTNPSLRSIFDICGSLHMKPSVFLRQVENLSGFELPSEVKLS